MLFAILLCLAALLSQPPCHPAVHRRIALVKGSGVRRTLRFLTKQRYRSQHSPSGARRATSDAPVVRFGYIAHSGVAGLLGD